MAIAITAEAIEFGIAHAISEIRATIGQIEGGEYPQYDENCRQSISMWLGSVANDRDRQVELGGGRYLPIDAGVRLKHLPGKTTLATVLQWQKWVVINPS